MDRARPVLPLLAAKDPNVRLTIPPYLRPPIATPPLCIPLPPPPLPPPPLRHHSTRPPMPPPHLILPLLPLRPLRPLLAIPPSPPLPPAWLRIPHLPIPNRQRPRRTPQPTPQLVPKQRRVLPPQKIPQHPRRLARAALDVDCLEDGDDVLEEELGVVVPAGVGGGGRGGGGGCGGGGGFGEEGKDL